MQNWFKRTDLTFNAILNAIINHWIGGAVAVIITSGIGLYAKLNIYLIGLGLVFAFILGAWFTRRFSSKVDYYEDRTTSPDFTEEIERAKEAWIAWHTASQVGLSGKVREKELGDKIARLILLAPEGKYLPIHARMIPKISEEKLRIDIITAKDRLSFEGVKHIAYFDGLMLSMIICNPNDNKNGRIRIELWNPFLETGNRPILYIVAKKHPLSFRRLRDAYDEVWKEINVSKTES